MASSVYNYVGICCDQDFGLMLQPTIVVSVITANCSEGTAANFVAVATAVFGPFLPDCIEWTAELLAVQASLRHLLPQVVPPLCTLRSISCSPVLEGLNT